MRLGWVILYFAVALVNIWASSTEHHLINVMTRPLLLTLLAFFFWRTVRPVLFGFGWWVLCGLMWSAVGDVILLRDDDRSFLLGLSSFLLAHLCYLTGFTRYTGAGGGTPRRRPLVGASLLATWLIFNSFLRNDLYGLQLPVAIYSAVIAMMARGAIHLRSRVGAVGNTLLLGVFLFMASDTVIALNRFKPEIHIWSPVIVIMTTYIAGQWFIALGVVRITEKSALQPK